VEFEVAFGSDGNRDGINLTKSGVNVITIVWLPFRLAWSGNTEIAKIKINRNTIKSMWNILLNITNNK
jgi:hypothetical protein